MFSTELEARLKPHREAYNATVNGWLLDRTFGITYPALLLETYHYVKHSCSLMDRAHDRLGPLDATLRTYLRTHRTEETGHEAWLLDDLAVLGYDRTEATQSAPLAETVAMIGSQLYVIDYCSPAGLIGYIYVMESKPPSEFFLSVLHEEFWGYRASSAYFSDSVRVTTSILVLPPFPQSQLHERKLFMSEMISPDPGTPADGSSDRRNFLSRSGIMIALLALAGGEAADAATVSSSEGPALRAVLQDAMQSGKVDPKNPSFGKLNKDLQTSLSGLTAGDLATLRSANAILSSRITSTADNNGTVGM
jgi:hypothetical protein